METRESLFYEVLEYLQNLKDFEDNFEKLMENNELGLHFKRRTFVDVKLIDYLLRLLEKMFLDSEKWIRYWVYDLDFGRHWEPGSIIESDGTDIKLQTKEDLHNFLQKKLIFKSQISLDDTYKRIEKIEKSIKNANS